METSLCKSPRALDAMLQRILARMHRASMRLRYHLCVSGICMTKHVSFKPCRGGNVHGAEEVVQLDSVPAGQRWLRRL